jgi:uncharacterized protein
MKQNNDLHCLDIVQFSQNSELAHGELDLSELPRLRAEDTRTHPDQRISWSLRGEQTQSSDQSRQNWLHLQCNTRIMLTCQRCLEEDLFELEVDRNFRFVDNEQTALAQDDENEEDLLVLTKNFNALELIEDELIMALPIVPRHLDCHNSHIGRLTKESLEDPQFQKPNPFAVLETLKKPTKL